MTRHTLAPALQDALLELLLDRLDAATTGTPLVEWATRALADGVETDSLVILAGLPSDASVSEAGPLLDRALGELGHPVPPVEPLRRAYVGAMSRALLAGTIDATAALDRIHARAVSPLGHPPDLAPWCFVWEGLDPGDYHTLSETEIEAAARRLASEWSTRQI